MEFMVAGKSVDDAPTGGAGVASANQNIDMARNDLSESFALRRRPDSSRVTAQSTL